MRRLMIISCLLASSTAALAGNADKAAILKVHEGFAASWNKHDYTAMASAFASDADLISPMGRVAKGKEEIEALYEDEQTTAFKASQFTSDCKSGVRLLERDVAIVTCSFEVTGGTLPDGSAMPALDGIYTTTMLKAKGRWVIVAGRPMIPFVPPAPAK